MKKFLALCVLFSMLLFVAPALATDANKVDLGSNLSFTFEPSSMIEKSLIIVPFVDPDLSSIQNNPIEKVEKGPPILLVFGVSVMLGMFFHNALIS